MLYRDILVHDYQNIYIDYVQSIYYERSLKFLYMYIYLHIYI
jgi:hypothetical protein